MRIEQAQTAMNGAPRENIFIATDDSGQRCGHAAVVEYVNHAVLPGRPLNYYLILEGFARARDMLFGAAYTRAMVLRKRRPNLAARIYTPCSPRDPERLMFFAQNGFINDDAELILRWILHEDQYVPKPPVGCQIIQTPLEDSHDSEELLDRLNPYSTTVHTMEWLSHARQDTVFSALAMVEDDRILGEIVFSGYGAEGRVHMLYTVPQYRRRGVASALLGSARSVLLDHDMRCMTAHVWQRNVSVLSLLETMGFSQVGQAMLYPGIDV